MTELKIDRITIDVNNILTSTEQNELLLKSLEENLNTGPIIGEARDVILHLANNLFVRDLYLDSIGLDVKKRELSKK